MSNSKDWIREIWTPISLCIPEHSMQVKMPKLVDSHVGSVQLQNKVFNQSPRKVFQWWQEIPMHSEMIPHLML